MLPSVNYLAHLVSLSRHRLYAFTVCLGATLQQAIFPINFNYFVKQKEKVGLHTVQYFLSLENVFHTSPQFKLCQLTVKLSVNCTVYFEVRLTSSSWYVQLSTISDVIYFLCQQKKCLGSRFVDKYPFLFGVLKSTVLGFFALLVREVKRKVPFQNLYGAGHPTESLWQ